MNKTIIKKLDVDLETGDIHVLLHKRVLDDKGNVLAQGNHRTVVHPGTDLDATLADLNTHFASGQVPVNGEATGQVAAPLDKTEWEAVRAHAKLAHTPAVRKRWADRQEALRIQEAIRQELVDRANAKAKEEADAKFKAAVADAVKAQAA